MLTVASAFALFLMLAIASLVYFVSIRYKLPYTVLLTFVGVLLVPLSALPLFEFLREFQLTPELLFFIFLPILIFESGFNMNVRRVVEEFRPIMMLAIVGYLISAFLIGGSLWFVFGWLNIPVPFLITLLFGALISATDPVAVLALFKEFGAPRRLSLIFEGESLMNDATALALFIIILGLIDTGISVTALGAGVVTFLIMLLGGALFGLIFGFGIAQLIGKFRQNEFIAIALMIVLAHLSFLSAEFLNEIFAHAGWSIIQLSPIITTTVASVVMGNYGRYKVTPHAEEFIDRFWSHFAFLANSVIFILVGLFVARIPETASVLIIPIIAAIIIVAIARALSIYITLTPYNLIAAPNERISLAWQHVLAWGSLRGALAIMLVFLVPVDLTIPGWTLAFSPHEFLLVLTVACIFATLFIKAPLVGPVMRRLKVGLLTPIEKAAYREAQILIHGTTISKLATYTSKGYVPDTVSRDLHAQHASEFIDNALHDVEPSNTLAEQTLRMYLIGREKEVLKELYAFDEMTESVFRRIYGKLTLQEESAEKGNLNPDPHQTNDYRDVFENMARRLRSFLPPISPAELVREQYLHYRTHEIIAHKALKELTAIDTLTENHGAFTPLVIERTKKLYEDYRDDACKRKKSIKEEHPLVVNELDSALALRSAYRVEEKLLKKLHHRGFLTPKLYIKLKEQYEHDMAKRKISYKSEPKKTHTTRT
ncbi:sodium:proton antiporter [Patescibacteria group bacterium]|nr:MAG: sodium:proton antiporter [Patescibacteria group bacterium]